MTGIQKQSLNLELKLETVPRFAHKFLGNRTGHLQIGHLENEHCSKILAPEKQQPS
jgi:hypothetical protein